MFPACVLLHWAGTTTVAELINNPEVAHIAHPTLKELLVSGCGTVAGAVMIASYRRSVIAGPLIGTGIAAGQARLAYEGVERLALDVLLIVVLGASVFVLKQMFVHRRAPIV